MVYPGSRDEPLELGFQLAYFIHGDKDVALGIVRAALDKLDAAGSVQHKRRYYNPRGKIRRRISMPELQLLQRLIYAESEKHERRKENATNDAPNQKMLVKHFIKHLVKITTRFNALHVTLGVSRLLCDYAPAQTNALYCLVTQSPDRTPEDGHWRTRRGLLMDDLKKRFGAMIEIELGPRNQRRFRAQPLSAELASLVRDCLEKFTPWQTRCCLPDRFDPMTDELDALAFRGTDPDEEHIVELRRYHALLHPPCFERLTFALGYDAPWTRLAIPQFLLATSRNEDDSGNAPPPKLSDEDRNSVHRYLSTQAGRRQASTAGLLQFVVDGEILATFDPKQAGDIRFAVSGFAEFIEIRTIDRAGELLLAVHPLALDAHGDLAEQQTEIALPGERKFTLSVTPARNAEGDITGATVSVRGTDFSLSTLPGRTKVRPTLPGWWKPALAFALLAVPAAGLIYVLMERSAPKPPVITETSLIALPGASSSVSPNASPLPSGTLPTPVPTQKPTPRTDEVVAFNLPANPSLQGENLTRSQRAAAAAGSLLAGQKVFVDAKGAPALLEPVVASIKAQLQAGGTFQFTDNRDEADIALKLNVEAGTRGLRVIAAVVNAKGEVLWPLTPGIRARGYDGLREKVIAELNRELPSDIQQLKQK